VGFSQLPQVIERVVMHSVSLCSMCCSHIVVHRAIVRGVARW